MSDPTPPASYTFEVPSYPQVFVASPAKHRRPYWLHLLLLVTTIFTTLVVGAQLEFNFIHNLPAFDSETSGYSLLHPGAIFHNPRLLLTGIPFCVTLMGILLAHELGHFVLCQRYGVYATLPYFLPGPVISPIGTFGAVIRIQSPIRSRQALFDIGIAGPIAGFLVAIPVLMWGLALSKAAPPGILSSAQYFGYPPIFHVTQRILLPVEHSAVSLRALCLHPVAIAGWVGMLATALNLLPGGQLDGGHIIYAIAPRAHKWVTRTVAFLLIPLGCYWVGWWLWAAILMWMGRRHPDVPKWPDIGRTRLALSLVALAILVLTFAAIPIYGYGILTW